MKNKIQLLPAGNDAVPRRQFLGNVVKAICATSLLQWPIAAMSNTTFKIGDGITVQQVIDIILKEIPGAPFATTVDTIKSGNANNKVTGIVTTMFTTVEVIREAVKLNANFIIAHEPTFYNHADDMQWVPGSRVVAEKEALLQKHGITVWRFHDYWHAHRPDGVFYGVVKKAGWDKYTRSGDQCITLPGSMQLKDVAQHLKKSLGIAGVRVVGNMDQSCKKVLLMPGASGGKTQMIEAEKIRPDALVVGEVYEWETAEYIRDARALGHNISLIMLGHAVSEEPGMEWLVSWLQPKISMVTITHIASQSPFSWV